MLHAHQTNRDTLRLCGGLGVSTKTQALPWGNWVMLWPYPPTHPPTHLLLDDIPKRMRGPDKQVLGNHRRHGLNKL